MRRGKPRQLVWVVFVCDYETCRPVYIFDSEEKAKSYVGRYKLNTSYPKYEQVITYHSMEVF